MASLDVADKAYRPAKAVPIDLSLEGSHLFTVSCKRQRDGFPVRAKLRHGVDQKVRALDVPELADINEIGGVGGRHDRFELFGFTPLNTQRTSSFLGVPIMRW